MQLSRDGAQHIAAALTPADLLSLERALTGVAASRPGTRLLGNPALAQLLASSGPIGRYAADHLRPAPRPVRALLLNKTSDQNWSLGWHQDRTIAVRKRIDTPCFTNWTIKSEIQHVEPPFALLERMLTLRVHLDPVGPANAPLLIAPGSHRLGRIAEAGIASTVAKLGTHACLAARGDIWLYSTPILHASEAATEPSARRVLQVDFSSEGLPGELDWAGI
jgi:hypothetical protein